MSYFFQLILKLFQSYLNSKQKLIEFHYKVFSNTVVFNRLFNAYPIIESKISGFSSPTIAQTSAKN